MIESRQAVDLGNGVMDCATQTKTLCASCGYDLTPEELEADTCADCGAALNLSQHVAIHATSVAAIAIAFE